MLYLSKGTIQEKSRDELIIAHGNCVYKFYGIDGVLWQEGNAKFASVNTDLAESTVLGLVKLGIAEYEEEETALAKYRILTRCVLCVSDSYGNKKPFKKIERTIMTWLKNAGIRLSVAELIYLLENKIKPEDSLLGENNRQALVERIYTTDNIADNLLENQMSRAQCRDEAVNALTRLIEKRYLTVL